MRLLGKSFLRLLDFSRDEISDLLDLSAELKEKKRLGVPHRYLDGKSVAFIFEKTSTRTRCAFDVAAFDLGAHGLTLDSASSQLGRKESLEDTAKVLGRYFSGISYRGFSHDAVTAFAENAGVPVWNALSDSFHPTQVLADLLTMREQGSVFEKTKLVFSGDGRNNMANSLMSAAAIFGMDFAIAAPKCFWPDEKIYKLCLERAKPSGARIAFFEDPSEAVHGADYIYTDVWLSLGEDSFLWEDRVKRLMPYRVDRKLMEAAGKDAKFLHCLPAFHDLNTEIGTEINKKFGVCAMEVTDEVFRSENSLVFDEAENRLHTIKALMTATLSERYYQDKG